MASGSTVDRRESRLEHLNQVLRAIRNVNQLITHETDPDRLLSKACDCLTETRGYQNAWIACFDAEGRFLEAYESGLGDAFRPMREVLERGELTRCARRAIESGEVVFTDNPAELCGDCPFSANYQGRGALVTRVAHGGNVYGTLTVSTPIEFLENEEETELLAEVAGDLGYALHNIDQTRARARAERRLHDILGSITDAFMALDENLVLTFFNAEAEKVLGRSSDEVLGRELFEAFPEARGSVFETKYREALATKTPTSFEAWFPVEPYRNWYDVKVYPQEQGITVYFRVTTERKNAEEALRASEERFRGVFETSPVGIAIVDSKTQRFLQANPSFLEIVGYTSAELRELSVADITHPDDWGAEQVLLDRCLGEKPRLYEIEKRYIHKSGQLRWVRVSGDILRFGGERSSLAVANVQDITQLRRHEETLRQYELAVEALDEQVAIVDAERCYRLVNDAFLRTRNLKREEVLGKTVMEVVGEEAYETSVREPLERAFAGETVEYTMTHTYPDTGQRDLVINYYPVDLYGGPVQMVAAVIKDVTELRRMEGQLHQSRKMEAIGQLAGGVAHDFNNQLAGILGYAEMLQKRLQEPGDREYATNIIKGAERAGDLTRQLLAFARKGQYQSVPVDLHATIDEVAGILERSLDKRIRIVRRLGAKRHVSTGDPSQLQSMLLNLALNARDAMPDGGEIVFATEDSGLPDRLRRDLPYDAGAGPFFCLVVADSGSGMDEWTRARIFEPFFTTKEPGAGTGMGLAAVYGTVQQQRGAIEVESAPGEGSTFRIYLPVSEESVTTRPEAVSVAAPRTARILVVEDEPILQHLVHDMLTGLAYDVVVKADGREALAYFRDQAPEVDLVILDLVMPGMSGQEVFRELRTIDPAARVLIASGYSVNGQAQELLKEGALGFIQKPFREADLSRSIAEALG